MHFSENCEGFKSLNAEFNFKTMLCMNTCFNVFVDWSLKIEGCAIHVCIDSIPLESGE